MVNRPVITVQCGNYANYIGSHFWNLQESSFVYSSGGEEGQALEVDHDILYREGRTVAGQPTFTPRLVALDLQGSLGSLPQQGELYGRPAPPRQESLASNWPAGHQVFKQEPVRRNAFLQRLDREEEDGEGEKDIDVREEGGEDKTEGELQGRVELEGQVEYWSDYLAARYHPRSVLLCDSFQHNNTAHPFDVWGQGRTAWPEVSRGTSLQDEVEDSVRLFAEECDVVGGVQVVADWQGGWGGTAHCLLDLLLDSYPGRPVLTFPCAEAEPASLAGSGAGLAGAVLTLASLVRASLVTPLSLARAWYPLPGQCITTPSLLALPRPVSHYCSSAVLALAWDTASLAWRGRGGVGPGLGDMAACLTAAGRCLAVLAAELPLQGGPAALERDLVGGTVPLLPGCPAPAPATPYTAAVTVRGLQPATLYRQRSARFKDCSNPGEYLASCVAQHSPGCRPALPALLTRPALTTPPFPDIFSPNVDCNGWTAQDGAVRPAGVGVGLCGVFTSWETSQHRAGASLASLNTAAAKLVLGRLHRLGESGVETEEWTEARETLLQLADCYQ